MLENQKLFDSYGLVKIEKKWSILSKKILETLKNNPDLRSRIISFSKKNNFSKNLIIDFLNEDFSFDEKLNKLLKRYKEKIINILSYDDIDENMIEKDINHIDYLDTDEKQLLYKKYSFSRDVKLLELASELSDKEINYNNEKIKLKSGINIINNLNVGVNFEELFNINKWKSRKKIKDRVYKVIIGDKKYILKERKTKFHSDTFKDGHIDGLNSLEEFELAKLFNESSKIIDGTFQVNAEKPISSVIFPDGYQFTIFEYDDVFEYDSINRDLLASEIFKNKEQFYDEYLDILENYKKYFNNENIIKYSLFLDKQGFVNKLRKFLNFNKEIQLTYKDFSQVKANELLSKSFLIYKNFIADLGYVNDDGYQYEIKLKKKENGGIYLEIFIYDFEYFSKIKDINEIPLIKEENIESYKKYILDVSIKYDGVESSHRDIYSAHYYLKDKKIEI